MNLEALFPKSAFELGAEVDGRGIRDHFEKRRVCKELAHLPKIFGVVCGDPHRSIRDQGRMKRDKKAAVNEAAPGVPPFRPGIGKQQIKRAH